MIKLTIEKLILASSLIGDVDSTKLSAEDCDAIREIAIACTYHVSVLGRLAEQAIDNKLDSIALYRIPLTAAITFANDIIAVFGNPQQLVESNRG